jgi:two-component system nitrogen regulation response regulator NtrX
LLENYPWPGNVRELKNIMERFIIMYPHRKIDIFDLPEAILRRTVMTAVETGEDSTLHTAREKFERGFILEKLAEQKGNVGRTAQALGIERSNLYRKMRQLGIPYSGRENGEMD